MSHPHLAFCPYLRISKVLVFGGWDLGPAKAFEARWSDLEFKNRSQVFLGKFVKAAGDPIEHPALLCRHERQVDGVRPSDDEIAALEAAIAFGFLDQNPRHSPASTHDSWRVITTDNTDLFIWPVDVDSGRVTVTTGLMV